MTATAQRHLEEHEYTATPQRLQYASIKSMKTQLQRPNYKS
jgi:hypothetical protein